MSTTSLSTVAAIGRGLRGAMQWRLWLLWALATLACALLAALPAWSWLGAAMQATALPFGLITAPGWRYHPALVAQGAATLAEMFPGRFWLALGSGEAINEAILGQYWPDKPERNARLRAGAKDTGGEKHTSCQ